MGMGHSNAPNPPVTVAFLLLPDLTLMAFTGFIEAIRLAADRLDRSRPPGAVRTIAGLLDDCWTGCANIDLCGQR